MMTYTVIGYDSGATGQSTIEAESDTDAMALAREWVKAGDWGNEYVRVLILRGQRRIAMMRVKVDHERAGSLSTRAK